MFGKALTAFGARSDVHTNAYSPVAATQTPTAAEPTSKWNCGKCSNANDAGAMTCNLCSAPRHAPAGVPSQAVMLAGRPQSSAFGATPVMPVMPPTSRNQVIQQPQQKHQQQQQQNAQFQMQAPLQFQQQNPQRGVAPLQQAQAAAAAVLAPAADAAARQEYYVYGRQLPILLFIMGFFIPFLALYVLL